MDKFEERIEQIEKFASQCYEDGERYSAFIAGAIWADNNPVNMWHDASEAPNVKDAILIQFAVGGCDVYTLRIIDDDKWHAWCKKYGVIHWAYISDLLPKGGEE